MAGEPSSLALCYKYYLLMTLQTAAASRLLAAVPENPPMASLGRRRWPRGSGEVLCPVAQDPTKTTRDHDQCKQQTVIY